MRAIYRVDIDCANCARSVEEALNAMDCVESVSIDFIEKRMVVEVDDSRSADYPEIEGRILSVARNIEQDFDMRPYEDASDDDDEEDERFPWTIAVGCMFLVLGLLIEHVIDLDVNEYLLRAVFLVGLVITGYDVIINAGRNILGRSFLDENFLMALATLSALAIGYWTESVAIMVFYKIGEYFEDRAVGRSRRSVRDLVGLKVPYTTVIRDGKDVSVRTETVEVGETIIVRPGEMVPIDGRICDGESYMDTKAMTGESVPRRVSAGDEVLSGYVNSDSMVRITTVRPYRDSAAAKVLALIEDSSSRKSVSEKFITRFARYYTPAVVLLAGLIALVPSLIDPASWSDWVYKGIVFLVVSCPCALVVSVPLSYFCGIGNASRQGILVKGSSYIEALSRADLAVFDKTGTLTRGEFEVRRVEPVGMTQQELIRYAASAEVYSRHPIARSVCEYAGTDSADARAGDHVNIPGKGVGATVDGRKVFAGSMALMKDLGIGNVSEDESPGTHVHVAVDGAYAGHILISDTVKHDARTAISDLGSLGVRTCMLTGDSESSASATASELGIDEYRAGLLPADKTSALEEMMSCTKGSAVFVGDGINDAPSLARADVGIAMGNVGSDAAIEAADVVIVDDSPSKVAEAVRLSRKTQSIVCQNIVFALGVKFAILGLTTFTDWISMWVAIVGDVGVLILAVANATRALGRSVRQDVETCGCGHDSEHHGCDCCHDHH